MLFQSSPALLALAGLAVASPAPTPAPAPVPAADQPEKRQDLSQLLVLASEAGIPLPTNPAQLISLYPLATALASYLPTSPVLSVLETAAPTGFLSDIVHDPSFAASFESQFAAGTPPSWFNALPTDVKSYLHTYQAGGLASAIGAVETGATSISDVIAGASSGQSAGFGPLTNSEGQTTGSGAQAVTGSSISGVTPGGPVIPTSSVATVTEVGTTATATVGGSSGSGSVGSTGAASTGSGSASAASTAGGSSSSSAGAARETGVLAAGAAAAVGLIGAVMVL